MKLPAAALLWWKAYMYQQLWLKRTWFNTLSTGRAGVQLHIPKWSALVFIRRTSWHFGGTCRELQTLYINMYMQWVFKKRGSSTEEREMLLTVYLLMDLHVTSGSISKGNYVSFSDRANDAYSLNILFFPLKDMKSQQLLSMWKSNCSGPSLDCSLLQHCTSTEVQTK